MSKNINKGEYTFKAGGKNINLLFSMTFWKYMDDAGYKMEDLESALSAKDGAIAMILTLSTIVESAGKAYSSKYKSEWNYTAEDVFDWFGEIGEQEIKGMLEAMTSTTIFGRSISSPEPGK